MSKLELKIVVLPILCAMTQVTSAHEQVPSEEATRRFQLYNECAGVAIAYDIETDLSEGYGSNLGSLRQDVREKLEAASILRHEVHLMTHSVRDTVLITVVRQDAFTRVSVNFFKTMRDPITELNGQLSTWGESYLRTRAPSLSKNRIAETTLTLLDWFIAAYTKANEDCAPFDVKEELM